MGEPYFASLLLTAGICLGFAVHAASLALHRPRRRYVELMLLSLLQAAYCTITYYYFRETLPERALPWGRAICVVTPYITYVFGQLVIDVTDDRRRWLRRYQQVNLLLTTCFVAAVCADAWTGSKLALTGEVVTQLGSRHRHRLFFAPLGTLYLGWVSGAFTLFAVLLFRAYRTRSELLPVVIGCVAYFVATVLDFGILTGLHDFYFLQHFGFFALVTGFWRVLAGSYERSVDELQRVIRTLEQQKGRLLRSSALIQEQKLSAMGTLAAGVAHEINNPIQGIQNYAELLRRSIPQDRCEHAFVREIAAECARVTEIVRALLRFAREDQTILVGSVRVRELIDGTLKLTGRSLADDDIQVSTEIEDDLPALDAQAQQLQQVIMNLVTNARDALNERDAARRGPRRIEIRARRASRRGDGWLLIEVEDNGRGMEPAVLAHIFDPFFTTKNAEQGTGLGLSISHGIVAAHGGELRCRSRPGEGTRFRIEIPFRQSTEAGPLQHPTPLPGRPDAANG